MLIYGIQAIICFAIFLIALHLACKVVFGVYFRARYEYTARLIRANKKEANYGTLK
jgi:hypothetical protein